MCVATGTVDRAAIELEGLATSIILSAISASVARAAPSWVEAKTIAQYVAIVGGIVLARKKGLRLGVPLAIVAFYGGAVLVFDHLAPHA